MLKNQKESMLAIEQLDFNPIILESKQVSVAVRKNKRRKHLYVNQYLGKHIPVRPKEVKAQAQILAEKLKPYVIDKKSTLIIGFAETATLLAGLVSDELDITAIMTTRYLDNHSDESGRLLEFEEEHSHAPQQKLFLTQKLQERLNQAKTVLLIDDEISTGKTVMNIIGRLLDAGYMPEKWGVGALLSTMKNAPDFLGLADVEWVANEAFQVDVTLDFEKKAEEFSILNQESFSDTSDTQVKTLPLFVVGFEEKMYHAFKVAQFLEEKTHREVVLSSTTQSPITVFNSEKYPIKTSVKSSKHQDEVERYLYNVPTNGEVIFAFPDNIQAANETLENLQVLCQNSSEFPKLNYPDIRGFEDTFNDKGVFNAK